MELVLRGGGSDDIGEARLRAAIVMAKADDQPRFLTDLDVRLLDDDAVWVVDSPLIYYSAHLGTTLHVPAGFQTDFASVPRVPLIYSVYGDRAHRESVIHDYCFSINSIPRVSFSDANEVFLEAMKCRGKSCCVRYPMYWAVCAFSRSFYHRRMVFSKI